MIGKALKEIRKARSLKQGQLAEKTGLTQGYLSGIETGKRGNPSEETLKLLSKALRVPVYYFYLISEQTKLGDSRLEAELLLLTKNKIREYYHNLDDYRHTDDPRLNVYIREAKKSGFTEGARFLCAISAIEKRKGELMKREDYGEDWKWTDLEIIHGSLWTNDKYNREKRTPSLCLYDSKTKTWAQLVKNES